MTYQRKKEGNYGEDLAAEFLKSNGYKILARNYKTGIGEVDILAEPPRSGFGKIKGAILKKHKPTIAVVEVKTKSGRDFGEGYEMVNYFKQRKLLQLAKSLQSKYPKSVIRIDVISVDTSQDPPNIRHFESAVEEG